MRQAVKKGGVEDSYVLGFGVMGLNNIVSRDFYEFRAKGTLRLSKYK